MFAMCKNSSYSSLISCTIDSCSLTVSFSSFIGAYERLEVGYDCTLPASPALLIVADRRQRPTSENEKGTT